MIRRLLTFPRSKHLNLQNISAVCQKRSRSCVPSSRLTEMCVTGDPSPLSSRQPDTAGPAFNACSASQMRNKWPLGKPASARSFYLNENIMLRMLDDPETVYSLPTWFPLCLALALFSTIFQTCFLFCSQEQCVRDQNTELRPAFWFLSLHCFQPPLGHNVPSPPSQSLQHDCA